MAISTLFLFAFGTGSWPVLACLWAIVPAIGIAMFAGAPMPRIVPEGTATMRFADLSKKPVFYLMFLMMLCAGAAEQGMSPVGQRVRRVRSGRDQGDWRLGGTCRIRPDDGPVPHDLRSAGASTGSHGIHCQQFRTVRGHVSDRSPNHGTLVLGLLACALTGFSVGIMWPGTFSMTADAMPGGGTLMFALLAVAGDLGCAGGPAVVGLVASANGDSLKTGLLFGSMFALVLLACVVAARKTVVGEREPLH